MTDMELADLIERKGVLNAVQSIAGTERKIIAALRRADLAQTEIKGHMRVVDDLKAEVVMLNGIIRVRGEAIAKAQARIAELEKDAARLDWLENHHTLHTQVDILYIVDGYQVTLMHEDGFTALSPAYEGHDLRAAIDAALKDRT